MRDFGTEAIDSPLAKLLRRLPIACAPDEKVAQALRRMRQPGIGSMIVVDADRVPLGLLGRLITGADGRIDAKLNGAALFVGAARIAADYQFWP